jgi:hypothetical protein
MSVCYYLKIGVTDRTWDERGVHGFLNLSFEDSIVIYCMKGSVWERQSVLYSDWCGGLSVVKARLSFE